MATVTGLTAERMLAIEAASVVDGGVVAGDLILTKQDGTQINAGNVEGPAGPQGPQGLSSIPGEVKLWPTDVLPEPGTYGSWVWADGAVYLVADHPIAAGHIGTQWRTFDGKVDPGAASFRVPDLRGLIAAGLDAMPGGSRANRMARAAAVVLAAKSGEEAHSMVLAEMAKHSHTVNAHSHGGTTGQDSPDHGHSVAPHNHRMTDGTPSVRWNTGFATGSLKAVTDINGITGATGGYTYDQYTAAVGLNTAGANARHAHGIPAEAPGTNQQGADTAHENVQPTVFVPYIVCLDS